MAPKKVQKQTMLSFWKGSSSNAPPTKSRRAQPPQHPDEDAAMASPPAVLTRDTYRYLGGSGVKVSNICLGTMTFGSQEGESIGGGNCDEALSHKILDRFAELGGNFIDTANIYTRGLSESIVGNWLSKYAMEDEPYAIPSNCTEAQSHEILDRFAELGGNFIDTSNIYSRGLSETIIGNWLSKQERQKFVLATKVRFQMEDDNDNSGGLSRKNIMWSVEESLKRLKTDYIDLFQIHCWDWGTPLEETLRTLDDLVRAGKIRYIGASNVSSWQLQKIVDYSKFLGLNKWITLQTQYNLLVRDPETEFVDVCKIEGMGLLPWSPLKGGWLTGKIKKGDKAPPEGTRMAWSESMGDKVKYQSCPSFSSYAGQEGVWSLLDQLDAVSKATGKSVAQVAIRWLLQKDAVSSVIIGCKTIAQLEDNVGAGAGWELTKEQMATLDAASAVQPLQVASMIDRVNANRLRKNWTQ